jgi:transposase
VVKKAGHGCYASLEIPINKESATMITTRTSQFTPLLATPSHLLLAFEWGDRTWKLGFTIGLGARPRIRQVPAGAVDQVLEEIARMTRRLKLPAETPVVSCDEAGREAFSLHRYLIAHDVTNHIVESSSIEVKRRARRAKTDR